MPEFIDAMKSAWKFLSELQWWAYLGIVICLSGICLFAYFGRPKKAAASDVRDTHSQAPQVQLPWHKIRLEDTEDSTTRDIAQYRLLVNWLNDAVIPTAKPGEPSPQITHLLFRGITTQFQGNISSVDVELRAIPIGESPNQITPAIAGLVVRRQDDLYYVDRLNPGTGEPDRTSSSTASEKTWIVKSVSAGQHLEVIVVVKAASIQDFERIRYLSPEGLFSCKITAREE
jgi:hypothetical protein